MKQKTIYINYHEEDVRVDIDDNKGDRSFLVYLSGEDGHLDISVRTDAEGNENWYEGEQKTTRAKEIGELIELATM